MAYLEMPLDQRSVWIMTKDNIMFLIPIDCCYQSSATLAGIKGVLMKVLVPHNKLGDPRVLSLTANLQEKSRIANQHKRGLQIDWLSFASLFVQCITSVPPMILCCCDSPHRQSAVLHSTADSGSVVTDKLEVELDFRLLE